MANAKTIRERHEYHQTIYLIDGQDPAIDTLLDLDGSILDQGDGYWVKIEARLVEVSSEVPHGIRYSLTLHEPYGARQY